MSESYPPEQVVGIFLDNVDSENCLGSGFFISDKLLMTAAHVLPSDINNSKILLSPVLGKPQRTALELECSWIESNLKLDVALVFLKHGLKCSSQLDVDFYNSYEGCDAQIHGIDPKHRVISTLNVTIDSYLPGKSQYVVNHRVLKGHSGGVLLVDGVAVGVVIEREVNEYISYIASFTGIKNWLNEISEKYPLDKIECLVYKKKINFKEISKISKYLMFSLSLLLLYFFLSYFETNKIDMIPKENILQGRFLDRGGEQFFLYDKKKIQRNITLKGMVKVLLPERGEKFHKWDHCNIAVLLGDMEYGLSSEEEVALKIIDLYVDSEVCDETPRDIILKKWGVALNAENYPSTHLRRARNANNIIKTAKREVRNKRYTQAKRDLESALEAYGNFQTFDNTIKFRVKAREESIKQNLIHQDHLINTVTDHPKHELIYIPWGEFEVRLHNSKFLKTIQVPEFWIDKYEVSNSQFRELYSGKVWSESSPSSYPVTKITWNEANLYCKKIGMRLVVESEFVKAALWNFQKKQLMKFPWGSDYKVMNSFKSIGLTHVQEDPTGGSSYRVFNTLGNADEWTIIKYGNTIDEDKYSVIGGSVFSMWERADQPMEVHRLTSKTRLGDTGFRCATNSLDGIDKNKVLISPY